jgi:hypothetical protein
VPELPPAHAWLTDRASAEGADEDAGSADKDAGSDSVSAAAESATRPVRPVPAATPAAPAAVPAQVFAATASRSLLQVTRPSGATGVCGVAASARVGVQQAAAPLATAAGRATSTFTPAAGRLPAARWPQPSHQTSATQHPVTPAAPASVSATTDKIQRCGPFGVVWSRGGGSEKPLPNPSPAVAPRGPAGGSRAHVASNTPAARSTPAGARSTASQLAHSSGSGSPSVTGYKRPRTTNTGSFSGNGILQPPAAASQVFAGRTPVSRQSAPPKPSSTSARSASGSSSMAARPHLVTRSPAPLAAPKPDIAALQQSMCTQGHNKHSRGMLLHQRGTADSAAAQAPRALDSAAAQAARLSGFARAPPAAVGASGMTEGLSDPPPAKRKQSRENPMH